MTLRQMLCFRHDLVDCYRMTDRPRNKVIETQRCIKCQRYITIVSPIG